MALFCAPGWREIKDMHELQERYCVEDSFFHRYFVRNAENRFVNDLKKFMLWHEGHFLDPRKKLDYVRRFLVDELEDFYSNSRFCLPQIGFSLTTRCTLHCQDCIALSPLFENPELHKNFTHMDLGFSDFKRELDAVTAGVDGIKRLFLHGGEPLLNRALPEIVDYSAACGKIELVELITNGTIVPSELLLDAIERHKDKVYLAINNYGVNPALKTQLHYEETVARLNERGIRHPLYSELSWYRQHPLKGQGYTSEQTRKMFANCWCKHSLQILNGVLAICPRASIGELLGLVPTPEEDVIRLREDITGDTRQRLVDFYKKDSFVACGYCAPQSEVIPPAMQSGDK